MTPVTSRIENMPRRDIVRVRGRGAAAVRAIATASMGTTAWSSQACTRSAIRASAGSLSSNGASRIAMVVLTNRLVWRRLYSLAEDKYLLE